MTPTPPEGSNADLIARLRSEATEWPDVAELHQVLARAAEVLAALSDSVPREEYDAVMLVVDDQVRTAERERDEALAVIEQVREWDGYRDAQAFGDTGTPYVNGMQRAHAILAAKASQAPADALARLKAEAGAQALDDALEVLEDVDPDDMRDWLRDRAAAIREEATS
jgi:hypothetical protein